jgi:hypothetical protein
MRGALSQSFHQFTKVLRYAQDVGARLTRFSSASSVIPIRSNNFAILSLLRAMLSGIRRPRFRV